MKKAILALFITVAFVSALASKDNGFLTNPTLSPELLEFVDTSCSGAIAGFNKGIQQLIHNIQAKSNQWLVYSDLAALDGSAYHLENLCDPADYELTSKLEAGQTPEQQQACSNLLTMIGSLLDQNQPKTFKSGYEQGLAWSQQALTFGSDIGSGCKISVEVKEEAQEEEYAAAEEEWGWGEENNETGEYNISSDDGSSDDSDVTLGWDMDVFVQKGSHEDCDSDEAQNDSESSEDDSEDNSEDSEDDSDDSDDSEDSDDDDDNSDDQDSSDDSEDDSSDDDSDDSSDDSNEEEQDGEEWNNGEWTTKAWASEEGTTKAWASGEWSTKAWDNKEWATEDWQNEEWADKDWDSIDWKNVDWSDFKPKSSGNDKPNLRSTFFYEVNPNGNTDSGSDWMNGGYQRYIPPGTGGNPGSTDSTGTSGIPGIPGIPSIPGNPGGAKATFLASVEQQASGNPWMDGDYKRYYGGDGGNGVAKSTLFLAAKKTKEVKDDSDENPWDGDYKKYYEGGNDGPKKSNFFYWAI